MGLMRKIDERTELFRTMADLVGADVADVARRGLGGASAYRTAVLSCTACQCEAECRSWQAEQTATDTGGSRHAPSFCRNASWLEGAANSR